MHKVKNKFFLTALLIHFTCNIWGQVTVEINRPELSFDNDRLYIKYDLNDKDVCYEVAIKIINSSGTKININALSGDIGENIKAGKNKSIVWDLAKDNIFLNETISVKIVAQLIPKTYNKGKLILQSTIWPGWGQTKYYDGKPFWIIGCVEVACLAGSYGYNQQSANSYDKYVSAITASDSEKYYDQAVQQDNTSKFLAYSAIGIWAANIIWVAVLPTKSISRTSSKRVSLYVLPVNVGGNNTVASLGLNINF